jgi:hypothetical protein
MTTAHLFPNGRIERGTASKPGDRPGYRWVQAYSQVVASGESMPLARREWYAMGKRDGFACKFHDSKEAAQAALKSETEIFRPTNHPLRSVKTCPKCKGHNVSLPAYPGDYFDCEDCEHSWPTTPAQLAKMRR